MANPIRIAYDRQNQAIVATNIVTAGVSFASVSKFPKLFLGDVRDVIFQIVDPPGIINGLPQSSITVGAYTVVDETGYAGIFSIGSNPVGNANPTNYINPLTLAWDATNKYYTGAIDLTLAATAVAMGANPTLAATASIIVRAATIQQTIWQDSITLYAPENPNAVTTSPSNPTAYFTAAEQRAGFIQKAPLNGRIDYFNSPDGLTTGVIYLANDGTWHQEILPVPLPQVLV